MGLATSVLNLAVCNNTTRLGTIPVAFPKILRAPLGYPALEVLMPTESSAAIDLYRCEAEVCAVFDVLYYGQAAGSCEQTIWLRLHTA